MIEPENKIIVLMGEHHTTIYDRENFYEIIEKQKQIIDIIVDKFGNKQFFIQKVIMNIMMF